VRRARLRHLRFELVPLEKQRGVEEKCQVQSRKPMLGSFPVGETPQPLVVTVPPQFARIIPGSGKECDQKEGALLQGTFTFASDGAPVAVTLAK